PNGPLVFVSIRTVSAACYFRSLHDALPISGLSPSLAGFPKTILLHFPLTSCGPNPRMLALWFGLFPFRSPLLRKSIFLSLPLGRSEEHTSELQSRFDLVCRLLLEKKKKGTM